MEGSGLPCPVPHAGILLPWCKHPLLSASPLARPSFGVRGNTQAETAPPWPGTVVTIPVSSFMTEGPGKEHEINKLPSTRSIQERSKQDATCPSQPPRILLAEIRLG